MPHVQSALEEPVNMPKLTDDSADARLALFDFAFDHAPIGVALVDLDGRILKGNAAFASLVGLPLTRVAGRHFKDFTHPDDLEADLTLFENVLEGSSDGYTIEKRYVHPDGKIVHVIIHVAAMRDANGQVVRFISQIEDITLHKEHERQLAEKAAQLELALEAVRGGFWQMDIQSNRFETSDRLAQFIGGPAAARLDLDRYLSRINVEDNEAADLAPLIAGKLEQNVAQYRLDTVAGERWMRCDRRLLRDSDGTPLKIVGMAIDFTEEHRRIEALALSSQTDILTGLLNRRGLAEQFPQRMFADGFSVLAVDLDGFKLVNDQQGHAAGDTVLVETARRLEALVRSTDLICRTGGDEFVLIVAGSRDTGMTVAGRIVEEMRSPVVLGTATAQVRASVGGVWAGAKSDIDDLIEAADALLYRAKSKGKDAVSFD
jgi:diguanylate cyclase (GGDEF)-like protein/PAS domain S-box-containing protein